MPKITVQGLEFEADAPYKEGDVLNANEADAINQTFLETSNVNVAEELVSMIITQRAYELNSRAITTADQMLQRLTQI